jgi:ATP/maltotriose-dependent transcriptional regulator MalT
LVLLVASQLAQQMPAGYVAVVVGITMATLIVIFTLGNRAIASQRSPGLRPNASEFGKDELLRLLAEHDALTPDAVALRTSLTREEAARALRDLAREGRIKESDEHGALVYSRRTSEPAPVQSKAEALSAVALASPASPNAVRLADDDLVESLTERELEVLTLMSSGHSNAEIAQKLFVSVGTIKTHTNNIFRKLDVQNRAQAFAKAKRLQLI